MELQKCIALLLLNVLVVMHKLDYVQAMYQGNLLFYEDDVVNENLDPFYEKESICPEPLTPKHGTMYCGLSRKNKKEYLCKAKCRTGYEFPNKLKRGKIICNVDDSIWSPKHIFPDCQREIKCDPPCTNGGKCEGNTCTCPPRFSGAACEKDNCAKPANPSNGNINCKISPSNPNSYSCEAVCNPGFEFPDKSTKETYSCDLEKGTWTKSFEGRSSVCHRICTPPCENRGVCTAGNICKCTSHYRGHRCEIESCQFPPKINYGNVRCNELVNEEDRYMCIAMCFKGYQFPDGNRMKTHNCTFSTGTWSPKREFSNCELICSPPCRNGGTCIEGNKCDCPENFKGDRCEIEPHPLEMCPEIPESLKTKCPISCPDGFACDGSHCVEIESCPCFKKGRFFEQGSKIKTKDCEICHCLPGGHSSCEPMKCPDCPPGHDAVMDSNCHCTCTGCPDGTRLCPTDGQCIKEKLWCNGVVDCPDDEINCGPTENTTSCSTDNLTETDHCEMLGNAIETFDGVNVPYEVCNHVLMKELKSEDYSVTVHKTCPSGSHESCYQKLVINVDGTVIKFGPGIDVIDFKNGKVPAENLWLVSERVADFEMKQIGNSLVFRSFKYHFDVTWNKEESAKITASKCLFDKIAGLCGFYNRKYKDDLKMPNGKIATDTQEFGDSWAIGSLDACETITYPRKIEKIANETCSKLNGEPFKSSCSSEVNMENRLDACAKSMQECLQRSREARLPALNENVPSDSEINECKCRAFESFVEACERAKNGPIKEWRMQHDCSPTCPEGMVWMDCGPGCNLTCDNYHQQTKLCISKCTPGCYCPSGLVLLQNQCVKPKMCHDCKCRGHGDPNYVTFDGRYYAFQGLCTYILAQHETSEDSIRSFKVLATNVECPEEPGTSCIEAITVHWNGHVIEKLKNRPVIMGKRSIGSDVSPFDEAGISIIYEPNKSTVIHIKEINLVVRYFDLMYGYTIELPSFYYYNNTEGLCGICNFVESDDLYHRDGYITSDIKEFAFSWLEGPKTRKYCEFPTIDPPPPPPPGLCNFTGNPCEIYLDPSSYAKSCLNDVTHSQKRETSMCRSKFQYAQMCCGRGVPLTEWLKLSGCESHCPEGMEYECTSACPKTCENYKTYKEEACSLTPMYTCVCPEGEVLKDGRCVKTSECETCNSGHVVGAKWKKGPCETCECLPDLSESCILEQCPKPPVCKSREILKKLPPQEGSCCDFYSCVPPTRESCKEPELQNCPPGTANVIDNSGECPVYKCKCFPHLCPPAVIPFLEEGENYTTVKRDCCPEIVITCNNKCSQPPTCNRGFKLSVQTGRCCDKYRCVPTNRVCMYTHKYRIERGIQKELPLEEHHDKEYEPGTSWHDGLCRKCYCYEKNGHLGYSCTQELCPDLYSCPDAEKYVIEEEKIPGSCCQSYKRVRCIDNGVEYGIGETWEIPESKNCKKIHSCNLDQNGEAILHTKSRCETACKKR